MGRILRKGMRLIVCPVDKAQDTLQRSPADEKFSPAKPDCPAPSPKLHPRAFLRLGVLKLHNILLLQPSGTLWQRSDYMQTKFAY
ncbi:MAG: hypothetical protein CMF18_11130 [Idiomarinaceae bacterium]|nr:hypothetical protein [Idiomarinaceae bacterium]